MSHQTTLVSVIIIFLDGEAFLEEAIESVFRQTYTAWELLLVDDGSQDGSTEIARRYAVEHPDRVRYLEHPDHRNQGKSASRNLGIRHSQGDYVAFLDADDVWLPRKLEQQVAILDVRPDVAMVYGLDQWWYSWSGRPEAQGRDFTHELGVPPGIPLEPPSLIAPFFLEQTASIPNPSAILVRREIIDEVGGFVEAFRGIYDVYEDQAFYAKVCLRAPVVAANACWDRYRQHEHSTTAIARDTGREERVRLFFLNWLADYLAEQGVDDPRLSRALQREIRRYRHPFAWRQWKRGEALLAHAARWLLPEALRGPLAARIWGLPYTPAVGHVRLGTLRRVTPISRTFGYDRGQPVDRYYIERFLAANAAYVRGHVLEVADDTYTRRFGGAQVTRSDVLHVHPDPQATITADLTCADHIPSETFDCVILTQTLQFIYDVPAALRTVRRILKPGGAVLATVPGIAPISRYDMERWGCYWAFTSLSVRRLFETVFPAEGVIVMTDGNVLAATAFLYGLAAEELEHAELDASDPDYQVIIGVRALKPAGSELAGDVA